MEYLEEFGNRVQGAARRKRITQKELAKRVFVTTSTMSTYCVGRSQPGLELVANIARELGVSTDYLLGLAKHPEPNSGESEYLNYVRGQVDDLAEQIKELSIKVEHIKKMLV